MKCFPAGFPQSRLFSATSEIVLDALSLVSVLLIRSHYVRRDQALHLLLPRPLCHSAVQDAIDGLRARVGTIALRDRTIPSLLMSSCLPNWHLGNGRYVREGEGESRDEEVKEYGPTERDFVFSKVLELENPGANDTRTMDNVPMSKMSNYAGMSPAGSKTLPIMYSDDAISGLATQYARPKKPTFPSAWIYRKQAGI